MLCIPQEQRQESARSGQPPQTAKLHVSGRRTVYSDAAGGLTTVQKTLAAVGIVVLCLSGCQQTHNGQRGSPDVVGPGS